ncbi:hypothetical protein [Winogradskya humida]|uniref:LppA-like lipoprotein n=1 Tax=Winogradskya humida TaxID=113566 RepID=A0ABQ4A4X0_9ACTN|nr:hypothetical protein [Actinoplanes humidus]GIE25894.1 hypothetical protein Ahu01nite_089960 [Actinoplanes humidus]
MTRLGIRLLTACVLTASMLVASCSNSDQPAEKEATLQAKPKAEVSAAVRDQAQAIADAAGGQLTDFTDRSAPCEGPNGETTDDGRWNLSGFAAIPLVADKHAAALQAIHDAWQSQGWDITENRTFKDGGGSVAGRNPQNGLNATITSSDPPKQLAVIIGSACYRPAQGEDPAND